MQISANNMDKNANVHWIVDVDVARKLVMVGHIDLDLDLDLDQEIKTR